MKLDKPMKNRRPVQGGMLGRIEDVLPPLQYGKEEIFVALENNFDSHMRGVGHIPKHPHIPLFRFADTFPRHVLCVGRLHSTLYWTTDAAGDCRRPQRGRSLVLPAPRRRHLPRVARAPPGVLMNAADGATPVRAITAVETIGHRRNVVNKVQRQTPSPKESKKK